MRRPRTVVTLAAAILALALSLGACGGSDDAGTTTTTTTAPAEGPGAGVPPASSLGALPPEFVKCMADQGFEIDSPDEIHSAPPEVLQACFGH